MDNLSGLTVFVRVAENLSYVAASRSLGVSASAVGKSIAKLELKLGVRLFHRNTRRITLTDEGATFFERCRHILDDIKDAETELSKSVETPRGRIKVSMPAIGYRLLMEKLPEFMSKYPEIEFDLDFTDRIVDVIEERFDAVIRSGILPDSRLMAKKLGPMRFVVCASPHYLSKHGVPQRPRDLPQHTCVRFKYPSSGKLQEWALKEETDAPELHLHSALICNNTEALMSAAVQGLGLAYLPHFVAKGAIESGQLKAVLENYEVEGVTFWLLWPSSRHMLPRLRVFVDFLSKRLLN